MIFMRMLSILICDGDGRTAALRREWMAFEEGKMKEMSEQYLETLRQGNAVERASVFVLDNGAIEGAHHKQWVLDQTLRQIAGERYDTMTAVYSDITGEEWDCGIAP